MNSNTDSFDSKLRNTNQEAAVADRIQLAAGYAVLLKRDGSLDDQIISQLQETYGLNYEQAVKAWNISQNRYQNELKIASKNRTSMVISSSLVLVLVLVLYAVVLSQLSPVLGIILGLIGLLAILGAASYLISYTRFKLKLPFVLNQKKNPITSFSLIAVLFVVGTAYAYFASVNVVREVDGYWIKDAIEAYGKRDHTGGKSRKYYTILKLRSEMESYRLFDSEIKFAMNQPGSFSLQPGDSIAIFVAKDRDIINMKQGQRLMTDLEKRNAQVEAKNLWHFRLFSEIALVLIAITLWHGYGLYQRSKSDFVPEPVTGSYRQ